MLCFIVLINVIIDYMRGLLPLLFEQVESNMWIDMLKGFTVGNLCTMFLASIVVIFLELSGITLVKLSLVAAAGGTSSQVESLKRSIASPELIIFGISQEYFVPTLMDFAA